VTGITLSPEAQVFFKALGDVTVDLGRVDFFACSLLSDPQGRAAFAAIGRASETHFAASVNPTGTRKSGGDCDIYFDADRLASFDGTFGTALDDEDDIYMAKLAEQAERYDEMVEYMKTVGSNSTDDLSLEKRNLLSVAYKNVVGARRASLRIISSIENKEKEKGSDKVVLVASYKSRVARELGKICNDFLELLDKKLIGLAEGSPEASVIYLKMKADRYRLGLAKSGHMGDAESAYKQATEEATGLAPTHPIRLGLALNFSAFLYEVQCKSDGACDLAKQAFDGAIISSISLCLAVSTRRQKVCSSIVSA